MSETAPTQAATPPAETQQQAPPAAPSTETPKPQPLAGKFTDRGALDKGVTELAGKLGKQIPNLEAMDNDLAVELYRSLERLQGRSGQQPPAAPAAPSATPPAAKAPEQGLAIPEKPAAADDDDIVKILGRAGLDGQTLAQQFAADGKLTDAQYAALKGVGFPKAAVDAYMRSEQVAAQVAAQQVQQAKAAAVQLAGGEQQLQTLLSFAAGHYDPEVKADLNRRLGNPKFMTGAITEIMAEHARASGAGASAPLVRGATPAAPGGGYIESSTEYQKVLNAAAGGDRQAQARLLAHKHAREARFQ